MGTGRDRIHRERQRGQYVQQRTGSAHYRQSAASTSIHTGETLPVECAASVAQMIIKLRPALLGQTLFHQTPSAISVYPHSCYTTSYQTISHRDTTQHLSSPHYTLPHYTPAHHTTVQFFTTALLTTLHHTCHLQVREHLFSLVQELEAFASSDALPDLWRLTGDS